MPGNCERVSCKSPFILLFNSQSPPIREEGWANPLWGQRVSNLHPSDLRVSMLPLYHLPVLVTSPSVQTEQQPNSKITDFWKTLGLLKRWRRSSGCVVSSNGRLMTNDVSGTSISSPFNSPSSQPSQLLQIQISRKRGFFKVKCSDLMQSSRYF